MAATVHGKRSAVFSRSLLHVRASFPWNIVMHRFYSIVLPCVGYLSMLWMAACATLPALQPQDRPASYTLASPRTTTLGRLFEAHAEQHAGHSGFALVASGREAFMARYAFALLAEKTVDVQYYIWEGDTTGRILLSALIRAADRGVRVRVLLDDMYTARRDEALAVLAAHPNIAVRLYNPFRGRSFRVWDVLFNFSRINHRMHNKAFIVDNAAAIAGGRNIGDNYFSVHTQSNYRDLDLFAVGPVVREVSRSFDAYWNSAWAFPMRAFVPEQPTKEEFYRRTDALNRFVVGATDLPFTLDLNAESLHGLVQSVPARLIWGTATVLADAPDKPETAQPGVPTL